MQFGCSAGVGEAHGALARGNNPYGRAQGGARAWAPAFDGTRRPTGLSLPEGVAGTAGRLRGLLSQWLLAELAPGRLMPWVPIAFGAGIACYFAADREPHVWAVLPLAIGAVAVAFVARRRPIGFPLAVGISGSVCRARDCNVADRAYCSSDPAASDRKRHTFRVCGGSRRAGAKRPHRDPC